MPPQSAATNAALAMLATHSLEQVMARATETLNGGCNDLEDPTDFTGENTVQAFATASFIDAFDAGKRAYNIAYKNTLAVSDAELSSSNQLEVARIRAISKENLSRTAAAHLMVGGRPGWLGSTREAFCTEGRLTGPEQAALSVFREAALNPAEVMSDAISTDVLVNGTTPGEPPSGSVRLRLAEAWGAAIPANRPVWEAYGLKEQDFDAARRALRDEIAIFARTFSAHLEPRALPDGGTPLFHRYAGTAGQAPDRPDAYWALLSMIEAPENVVELGWRPQDDNYDRFIDLQARPIASSTNLAGFVDRAYSWARLISFNPNLSQSDVLDPLTLLLGGEDIRGRLMHCTQFGGSPNSITHVVRVAGYEASDELVLVRGEDHMTCAVNGHIEGARCVLPSILDLPAPEEEFNSDFIRLTDEDGFDVGPFQNQVKATFQEFFGGRYYLIRPRQKGAPNPGPGEWELLLGTPIFERLQVGQFCRDVPIVPEATERAAHALAPSRDWCGQSEVSCAGTRFDERMPLEDELSTDHDDIESSWRHYLDLARRAVDHADALGEEYVRAALDDDLREEEVSLRRQQQEERALGEFQRIQEICGSSANPNAILNMLGRDADGDLDLSEATRVQCVPNPGGEPHCGPRKLADLNPELGALAVCLGTFGDLEETHLGDGFLCVGNRGATFAANERSVLVVPECQDSSMAAPDDVGPDVGCEDLGRPMNVASPRYHCVPGSDGLGMYTTASLLPDPTLPLLCNGIAQLRANPAGSDTLRNRILEAIKGQQIFVGEESTALGSGVRMKLEFIPNVGELVRLDIGQGLTLPSHESLELCGAANTECVDGSGGLLCRQWNCADAASRAELNERLYKAGAALMHALPGPPARLDTLWYLNFYLQPNRDWTGRHDAANGQWRVFAFDDDPRKARRRRGATIFVPTGTSIRLGSEIFSLEGPEPPAQDEPPSGDIGSPNDRPTQLALRDAFLPTRGGGFNFELLASRPAPTEGLQRIRLVRQPLGNDEGLDGLGAVHFCSREPGTILSGCDLNYTNNLLPNFGELKSSLQAVGLELFSPTSAVFDQVAPASERGSGAAVFGKQVYPPVPSGDASAVIEIEIDVQAELDALELACAALEGNDVQLTTGCGENVEVQTVADLAKVGNQLECLGNEITYRAATAVYRLPEQARESLKNGERVFDATGGSLAVAVSELRTSLLEAATSGPIVGGTLQRFGQELRALRGQLERIEVDGDISALQLQATIANQTAACLAGVLDAATIDPVGLAGATSAAFVTCANTIAQIGFAVDIASLEDRDRALQSQVAIADFSGRVADHVTTLETQSVRLSQALEGIQRNLEIIDSLKAEARRAMQSAVWLLSRQAANQTQISNVLDNLKVGKFIRYERAFEDAQKMAFLAKRSIEMRLGMSLADMVYDLPLVTAPASWEATVCQSTGIDYSALRESTGQGENFADAFLGDYVTKLEQVVESYRLVNNFHEGRDTAVISLRDDIHNTRAACDADSPNHLYWASRLEPQFILSDQAPLGWTLTGCDAGEVDLPAGNCIVPRQIDDSPFFAPLLGQPPVAAYEVEFGHPDWCEVEFCAYEDGAALSQAVELEPGRYRLSWYTTDSAGAGGVNAARVRHADGTELPIAFPLDTSGNPTRGFIEGTNDDWNRVYFEFDVFEKETVTVGFERPSATDFSVPLAAPMLEKLEDPFHARTPVEPPRFMDTTDVRKVFLPVCEDTTGENFREQKWDRNCLKLCPDGYASDCADQARTECFWETSFNVSQRSIEAGHMLNQSGFARGNFNYRIRKVGVNFVGTDLRACEDSDLPSTCNAAGFIPYTILHAGPYNVRNHMGQDYRLALFPGRIEHARGLGIERYVTNPMSEADRTLIEPYMRTELNGRPLDGEFIIRVWDEAGVNFRAIQDVQIVLDYGYWTRFN